MGLFGGSKATTTKTTVTPDKRVEADLKDIVSKIQAQPLQEFIEHKYAEMTPEQKSQVEKFAQSGDLRSAASLMSGQFSKGVQQVADNNKYLQSELDKPITVTDVLSDRNQAINSQLNKYALGQATGAASPAITQNSAGARAAARRNAGLLTATNAFTRAGEAGTSSLERRLADARSNLSQINTLGDIGAGNVNAGLTGLKINQQATSNQLAAGNALQNEQNAIYQNEYQNANAKAVFPFQQLQNKQAMVSQVANMAGYTTTGTATPAQVSTGQKLLGAGIATAGALGQAGVFSPSAAVLNNNLKTGASSWDSINSGRQVDTIGGIPVYAGNKPLYNNLNQANYGGAGAYYNGGK